MRTYMDYIEEVFLSSCGWTPYTSYADITLSSRNILDFSVPHGLALHLTGQPSGPTIVSHTLSSLGAVSGSLSYLYTSVPMRIPPTSEVPLNQLVQRFRHPLELNLLGVPTAESKSDIAPKRPQPKHNSLLYGRMFLPGQAVEAMAIYQVSPVSQLLTQWVCDPRMIRSIIFTSTYQVAGPRWSREFIFSSHENLLGFRALGTLGRWSDGASQSELTAGCEAFYAASKKSPGLSFAANYAARSKYTNTPLTLTMVSNPLMGSVSVAYALKPTAYAALSSRFDFNFYSYISDLTVGCELWRTEPVSFRAKPEDPASSTEHKAMSVFKASTALASQTARLLWETSYRGFLFSIGGVLCYGDSSAPINWGIELSYAGSEVQVA